MKKILLGLSILLLVGCEQRKEKISMTCNDIKTEFYIQEKNEISCNLLGDNYIFKVKNIKMDEIILEANEYGLTEDNNLLEQEKEFILSKDNELILTTQTTDYQESVIFKWEG